MKLHLLSLILCLSTVHVFSQNNVGIGTSSPATSAILDVSSTSKGLLTPRMTTAQRTAIFNPAKGLLVYDTDLNGLYHYNGSTWSAVGGGVGLTLPYAGVAAIDGVAFKIDNVGVAIQASATKTSTAAIMGSSNAVGGYGVIGQSHESTGFGVAGYSSAGNAVYGFSANTGTALRGVSTGGYGLFSSGNLRLTGGNTSPSTGAVLTSVDVSGNAVWKPNKIGFCVIDPKNEFITHEVLRKMEFATELYDHGNGFTPFAGTTTSSTSVYTIPVNGLYHFSSIVSLRYATAVFNFVHTEIYLYKNGSIVANNMGMIYNPEYDAYSDLTINADVPCVTGDKIWIEVYQRNTGSSSVTSVRNNPPSSRFSGHLIFAD